MVKESRSREIRLLGQIWVGRDGGLKDQGDAVEMERKGLTQNIFCSWH